MKRGRGRPKNAKNKRQPSADERYVRALAKYFEWGTFDQCEESRRDKLWHQARLTRERQWLQRIGAADRALHAAYVRELEKFLTENPHDQRLRCCGTHWSSPRRGHGGKRDKERPLNIFVTVREAPEYFCHAPRV
jgi:hypothetical protein